MSKKTTKYTDMQIDSAVESLLGLDSKPQGENPLAQQMQALQDHANIISPEKQQQTLEQLLQQNRHLSQPVLSQKISPKVNIFTATIKTLLKTKLLLPTFAGFSIMFITFYLTGIFSPATNYHELFFPHKNRSVNISQQAFSQTENLVQATLGNKLSLTMRKVTELQSRFENHKIILNFISGSFYADFKNDKKEKQKDKLIIITRHAEFEIVGTSFFIEQNEEQTWLLLTEGSVNVLSVPEKRIVHVGQLWSSVTNQIHNIAPVAIEQYKNRFLNTANLNLDSISQLIAVKKQRTQKKQATIELKNGETVIGEIIREEADFIFVKTNFGYILKLKRDTIKAVDN